MDFLNTTEEPARIVTLFTAAAGATVALLALIFKWSADVTAGLTLALSAWIAVAGELIRSKVTPLSKINKET